jgi:hypothetical protein
MIATLVTIFFLNNNKILITVDFFGGEFFSPFCEN